MITLESRPIRRVTPAARASVASGSSASTTIRSVTARLVNGPSSAARAHATIRSGRAAASRVGSPTPTPRRDGVPSCDAGPIAGV